MHRILWKEPNRHIWLFKSAQRQLCRQLNSERGLKWGLFLLSEGEIQKECHFWQAFANSFLFVFYCLKFLLFTQTVSKHLLSLRQIKSSFPNNMFITSLKNKYIFGHVHHPQRPNKLVPCLIWLWGHLQYMLVSSLFLPTKRPKFYKLSKLNYTD